MIKILLMFMLGLPLMGQTLVDVQRLDDTEVQKIGELKRSKEESMGKIKILLENYNKIEKDLAGMEKGIRERFGEVSEGSFNFSDCATQTKKNVKIEYPFVLVYEHSYHPCVSEWQDSILVDDSITTNNALCYTLDGRYICN